MPRTITLVCLLLNSISLAVALDVKSAASAPLAGTISLDDGLYHTLQGRQFIKIVDSTESGFTISMVANKDIPESYAAPAAGTFDGGLIFRQSIPFTSGIYVSQTRNCIITITVLAPDAFVVKVNSLDECAKHPSQLNFYTESVDISQAVQPFLGVKFKLDTNPIHLNYFSGF